MKNIKIGVAITVHNLTTERKKISEDCVSRVLRHVPEDTEVVIVDDASTLKSDWWRYHPKDFTLHTFKERQGVARAKNKCVEILLSKGCTDIFLFDDDVWVNNPDIYFQYSYQSLPYLNLYCKGHLDNPKKIKSHFVYKGQKYIEATSFGSSLYYKAAIFDVIGGFNILLGKFGEEHGELEERIYTAGYSPKPSFDFYRPNGNYPITPHPATFHGFSSVKPTEKVALIRSAQKARSIYGGIRCPYKEEEYAEFLKNVQKLYNS